MRETRRPNLDRDQVILERLAKIEHKVDSIEQTNAFALRPDAAKYFEEVKKIFGRGSRKPQVYLAVDGSRSVQEIAKHLGMNRQHVGPNLKALAEEGLLELSESVSNRDIWSKKPIDRTLRITKFLCEEFGLRKDGLKNGKKKAAKRRAK